jgi:hypothetical protein
MNAQQVVKEIHARIESQQSAADASSGNSASLLSPVETNELAALNVAYGRLYEIRNLVGQTPPSPNTFRARLGGHFIRLVQRMLFWYTPQILRFHDETASVLASARILIERQFQTIGELRRIDAMWSRCDLTRRPRKILGKIPCGIVRDRNQSAGARRGAGQEHVPERKIPSAKELGMFLVLQVVEYRNLRAAREQGRGEAGIQQNVDAMAGKHSRKANLFKENARGPKCRPNRTSNSVKRIGHQFISRFPIQKDEILVSRRRRGSGAGTAGRSQCPPRRRG